MSQLLIWLLKCYVYFFFQTHRQFCSTGDGKRIDFVLTILQYWRWQTHGLCLDNLVVLEMAEGFSCHDKPVMVLFYFIFLCYTPPRDSPAYAQTDTGMRIKMTDHCLADLYKIKNDFYLFMCGDFNARTNEDNVVVFCQQMYE